MTARAPGLVDFLRVDPESPRVAVLVGPSGSGKTFVATAIARALNLEIVWMSVSHGTPPDFAAKVAETKTPDGRRKVLIYEEYEGLSSVEVGGLAKLPPVSVVLLACSTRGRTSGNLPRNTLVFSLRPPDTLAILRQTFRGISDDTLEAIAAKAGSDVRAALGMAATGFTDRFANRDGLDLAHAALNGHFDNLADLPDPTAVSACHENYVTKNITIHDAQRVAESLSLGDLMDVSAEPLLEAHELGLRATSLTPGTFEGDITKFGMVWSKASTAAAKHATFLNVRKAMGKAALAPGDLGFLRLAVASLASQKKYEDIATLAKGAGLDPATLLWMMRLFSGKYTLTTHGHVKKHF